METKSEPEKYAPEANEIRVSCPKCGSPYVVTFDPLDVFRVKEFNGFVCSAGDCGYTGSSIRAGA